MIKESMVLETEPNRLTRGGAEVFGVRFVALPTAIPIQHGNQ